MTDNAEHLVDFATYAKEMAANSDPDHIADTLVLTCMDFGYFPRLAEYMESVKYDHVFWPAPRWELCRLTDRTGIQHLLII